MSRPEFVWVFDVNRRVYPPAPPGRLWASGGPIWREHWRKTRIVGETRRSWIDEYGKKYPKDTADNPSFSFSEHYIERRAWLVENRHKLADAVSSLEFEQLVAVAKAIGYAPLPASAPEVGPATETSDDLWNPHGNDGMRHLENSDVTGGESDATGAGQ